MAELRVGETWAGALVAAVLCESLEQDLAIQ